MFVSSGVEYKSRAEHEQLRLRSGPRALSDELPAAVAGLGNAKPDLIARLRTRLGLGDDPAKRMALYYRLQKMHNAQPELVELAISQVWAAAVTSARQKDRYFCASILRRCIELGVLVTPEGVQHEPI